MMNLTPEDLEAAAEVGRERLEADVETAKALLHQACHVYCRWYDEGKPQGLSASAMAYELVTWCRQALAALESSGKHSQQEHGTKPA